MKVRTSIALAGSAAALATAGLLAGPALASSSTTLKFTAVPVATHTFTKGGLEVDKDVSGGKTIAYDIVDFTGTTSADVSLGLSDGFLYGHFTISSTGVISGKVTGGSSAYKGDTGTITGKALKSGASITLTYS